MKMSGTAGMQLTDYLMPGAEHIANGIQNLVIDAFVFYPEASRI